MKSFTTIIATILLCGCLFFASAMPGHKPVSSPFMYGSLSFNYHFQPNFLNTFNNLFPIYSYQKEVCRKPSESLFLMNNNLIPFSNNYEYEGFTYKTIKLGSHFLKIEGNSIYKQGNSLLLIPHSYITPVTPPAFRPAMPKMVVPKVD